MNTRSDHEGLVRLALIGKQTTNREDVFRTDPAVWHVADETRTLGVVPRDLGPLIPGQDATIGQEEIEQLMSLLPSAEPHQRPDDANFVSAVVVPGDGAAHPFTKSGEIFIKGLRDSHLRQMVQLVDQGNGDGRCGGVKVGKLHRSGYEIQVALL